MTLAIYLPMKLLDNALQGYSVMVGLMENISIFPSDFLAGG